jgi:hypothetical protein
VHGISVEARRRARARDGRLLDGWDRVLRKPQLVRSDRPRPSDTELAPESDLFRAIQPKEGSPIRRR